MNRRDILKQGGLMAAGTLLGPAALKAANNGKKGPVLTIAHITDVHIREDLMHRHVLRNAWKKSKRKRLISFSMEATLSSMPLTIT